MRKGLLKCAAWLTAAVMTAGAFPAQAAFAGDTRTATQYAKVQEIKDWGAATTKLIVDLKQTIADEESVQPYTFEVNVKRTDIRLSHKPLLESGKRRVTNAYVSDRYGNQQAEGSYATLELEIGPDVSLGSPLNYYGGSNVWINCEYYITQNHPIISGDTVINNLYASRCTEVFTPELDRFSTSFETFNDPDFGPITLNYAYYTPPAAGSDTKPLIIWLHGGGEGGSDATIPLSANKAVQLADESIQKYFDGGAYVLAPQSPTKWMDDGSGRSFSGKTKPDASSMYSKSLMNLIEKYTYKNPSIDKDKIYIGGCSNGGFMTLRMLLDYPEYFAAAFPVCEGINDDHLTDDDIALLAKTPMWFVCAATDGTLPPADFTLPTFARLLASKQAGKLKETDGKALESESMDDLRLTYFDDVHDLSGNYNKPDGTPHEYDGHWSWVYVYNDDVKGSDGLSLFEWLSKY